MPVRKFKKKPIVVEAIQFITDAQFNNTEECIQFTEGTAYRDCDRDEEGVFDYLVIPTPEGDMSCTHGDWIIKEPFPTDDRRFYPCKEKMFWKTYENIPMSKQAG